MKPLCIYLTTILISEVLSKFHAGRIRPGKFEYPKLNGWMLVDKAVNLCEADLACGGFTFKGSYYTRDELMEIYFFHIIKINKKDTLKFFRDFLLRFSYLKSHFPYLYDVPMPKSKQNPSYLYWSFYVVDRDYVKLSKMRINNTKAMKSIQIDHGNVLATNIDEMKTFEITATDTASGTAYSVIDFDDFQDSVDDTDIILINLNEVQNIQHTFPTIDRCCKTNGRMIKYDKIDNVQRIHCNISKNEFKRDYTNKRKIVILTGCQEKWKAKNWTFGNILGRYMSKWPLTWYHSQKDDCYAGYLNGPTIYHMMKDKVNIKSMTQLSKSLKNDLNQK